jgi:hypothetical protein
LDSDSGDKAADAPPPVKGFKQPKQGIPVDAAEHQGDQDQRGQESQERGSPTREPP